MTLVSSLRALQYIPYFDLARPYPKKTGLLGRLGNTVGR